MSGATWRTAVALLALVGALACRSGGSEEQEGFTTSGDPQADQRAEQRVAEAERAREESEDGASGSEALYQRLGGESGVAAIVRDFVERVLADPRANWRRIGVERSGVLGLGEESLEWKPTDEDVARMRAHVAQFIAVTSGGPTRYDGRTIDAVHAGMQVTNAEFDASIGALKATLDHLGIGDAEQKELLAIFESTRAQIVEER